MYSKEQVLKVLERYPHIYKVVNEKWNKEQELAEYVVQLLNDTRDGHRQGFPADVSSVLVFLSTRGQTFEEIMDPDFVVEPTKLPRWW